MSKPILDHLRNNLIGYLALFLTLSMGTAYATHKGGANTISSVDIIDGEVKNPDLGANAVTGDKVLNRSINFGDIAADAISSGHIANGTVQSSDVRNNDLTGLDIADTNSLGGAEINEGALTAGGDLFGSLANAQLNPSSVDAQSLAPNSVDGQKIKDDAVEGQDIATASVNTDELAPSSVDGQKISDDAVDKEDIRSGAVESPEIADDAVKAQEIDTAAVDSAEIAPNAVGTSEIGNIPAVLVMQAPDTVVPDSTRTTLLWDTEIEDTQGMHEGGTSALLTAPVAGIYSIAANLYWEPDDTPSGFRETAITCLGCELFPGDGPSDVYFAHLRSPAEGPGGGQPSGLFGESFLQPDRQPGSLSTIAKLSAGAQIKVDVWQNSGEPQMIKNHLTDASDPMISPSFSMTWIAPTA